MANFFNDSFVADELVDGGSDVDVGRSGIGYQSSDDVCFPEFER